MSNDIRIEGVNLNQMSKRIWKRQHKIAQSVFWTQVEDIDNNLYDYILDKVNRDSDQLEQDEDLAVDRWIKEFWVMCQEVFTVPTIKEFLQARPGFYHQYFQKYSAQSVVEPRNLSRLYEEEHLNQEDNYALP